jgi:hypothetical protein
MPQKLIEPRLHCIRQTAPVALQNAGYYFGLRISNGQSHVVAEGLNQWTIQFYH